jgi:3-deoxy-D-manno-octulosonate 8-phosphate phosphatase (KDO 8-P phosphatase)
MIDMSQLNAERLSAASRVELLVLDCDGVLTDGKLYFGPEGEALKSFHVHDGQGIKSWHRAGFRSAVITGRTSPIGAARAAELGVDFFLDDTRDKAAALDDLLGKTGLGAPQVAYVGDDIADLGPMRRAGFAVAVANCVDELRDVAAYVTQKEGGAGAVREAVELLLHAKEWAES